MLKETIKFTYQDYLMMPSDKRYELIEGEFYAAPSPNTSHQRTSRKLEILLEDFVTRNDLGEMFHAPYDVVLSDEDVVQPDILFVSKERSHIITEKNIQGAPDLVIEILSTSTAYMDLVKKKKLYAKSGIKEYWIIDPKEKTAEVLVLKEKGFETLKVYSKEGTLESPTLKDLRIALEKIF